MGIDNDYYVSAVEYSYYAIWKKIEKSEFAGTGKDGWYLFNPPWKDCGYKTNLQIALLRAVNIPARYHIAVLRKESLKGLIPESVYNLSPDLITHHPWCECFLSGKWIACDTLFDKALTEAIYKKGILTKEEIPSIEWDGENDLITMTAWIVEDKGTYHSIDDIIIEVEKEQEQIPMDLKVKIINETNTFIELLRKNE